MDASIIIPSRNAAQLLDTTLAALARQDTGHSFEVIVVDDGSADETRAVCAKHGVTYTLMPRAADDPVRKAAEARNLGAEQASGGILIFLDADMVPGTDFVERHCSGHRDRTVIIGIRHETDVDGAVNTRDPREPYFQVSGDDLSRVSTPWFLLYSHNFSVSRADFMRVQGFSTCYPVWGAEDQDIGYKLWRDGCRLVLDRSIVGVHQYHPPEYRTAFAKKVGLMQNATLFYERYRDEAIARAFGLDKKLIMLRLGSGCNNRCTACTQHEGIAYHGSPEALRADIAVPKDWRIIISGSEPTLSSSLFSFARALAGYSLELETNGRAFSYQSFCREAIASGIPHYLIHMDDHTAALHEQATHAPGSFSQSMRGIDNLRSLGQGVGIRLCITQENAAHAPHAAAFYRERGLPVQLSIAEATEAAVGQIVRDRRLLARLGVTFSDPFMRCVIEGNEPPLDIRGCPRCQQIELCGGRVGNLVDAYT